MDEELNPDIIDVTEDGEEYTQEEFIPPNRTYEFGEDGDVITNEYKDVFVTGDGTSTVRATGTMKYTDGEITADGYIENRRNSNGQLIGSRQDTHMQFNPIAVLGQVDDVLWKLSSTGIYSSDEFVMSVPLFKMGSNLDMNGYNIINQGARAASLSVEDDSKIKELEKRIEQLEQKLGDA